jgi:hypothetical protein
VPDAVEELGVLLHHEAGAEDAQVLLVGEHAQQNVTRRRLVRAGKPQEGGEHHRHPALHVQRSPAPDLTVDQLTAKRIVTPPLPIGGYDIDMPLKQQGRCCASTWKSRQQVRPRRILGQKPRLKAGGVAEIPDPGHTLRLVARRVRRVEPNQGAEQLDRIVGHGPTVPNCLRTDATAPPHPLYSYYAELAHRPGGISALTDQQLAAGVMWVPGLVALVAWFHLLFSHMRAADTRELAAGRSTSSCTRCG